MAVAKWWYSYDPGAQHLSQMFFFDWESILERKENRSNQKKILVEIDWNQKLNPHTLPEVGGTNVEHHPNLTSPGIQHRVTRVVTNLDIDPAQQDLTSVIKWELVDKPYKATHRKVLCQFTVETKIIHRLAPRRNNIITLSPPRSNSVAAKTHFPSIIIHRHWSKEKA